MGIRRTYQVTVEITTADAALPLIVPSGRRVKLWEITPADIDFGDIAAALGHTGFNFGHTKVFYSTAQFAIELAKIVKPEFKAHMLLGPAAMAYCGNSHPSLSAFAFSLSEAVPIGTMYGRVMHAIYDRLGLGLPPDGASQAGGEAAFHVARAMVERNILPPSSATASCTDMPVPVIDLARSPDWGRRTWIEALREALKVHGIVGPLRRPEDVAAVFDDEVRRLNDDVDKCSSKDGSFGPFGTRHRRTH